MKIALGQMAMTNNVKENLEKTLSFCDKAKGSDLVLFPEVQLAPFFPQYEKQNVDEYCLTLDSPEVEALCTKAGEEEFYLSPNLYIEEEGNRYDMSLWIEPDGTLLDTAAMVHIAQAKQFYEQDYYTPSEDGFKVFTTEFGRVGIVICYDRHLPESIRTCTLMGADLILIPTANTKAEDLEMFEWEVRVQAMQNQVFIAMCNRVGKEGDMDFAGESLVVGPRGEVIAKAGDGEELLTCHIDLMEAAKLRQKMPYLGSRRGEMYL